VTTVVFVFLSLSYFSVRNVSASWLVCNWGSL